jgi:hypothetical protein
MFVLVLQVLCKQAAPHWFVILQNDVPTRQHLKHMAFIIFGWPMLLKEWAANAL